MQGTGSGVTLWRQVADGIERGIAEGRFAAGDTVRVDASEGELVLEKADVDAPAAAA